MLDTNIAIYVIKRRPVSVMPFFNRHAGQLCMSAITLAELQFGAEKSAKPSHNLAVIGDFVSRLKVLDYGSEAAAHYGDLRAHLERAGSPVGENDLHIGAHARSRGLILVTNNLRDFEHMDGLRLENWAAA